MINPFTGLPRVEKKLTSDDKELLLRDDKWLFDLSSKLNIVGHGGGGAGGGAVDSVNGQTGVVVLDSDDVTQGATNLYSQWEVNTYTNDFVQPRTTTQGLVVGNDLHSSVSTAFNAVNSVFNGDPLAQNGGINYFVNLAYGTGFSGFGGLFVGGRANGSPGTPTQTLDSNWTAGYTSAAFTDTNAWEISGANHILPGLFFMAAGNVTTGSYTPDIYIGGLVTRMITLETDTNAIKFNEAQLDSDITFYNDTGTTMTMDGATGLITVGNSISFSNGQGIDWAGTNNDVYANTGTGIVTVRGVNGVNARVGSTDVIAATSAGADITGVLGISDGSAAAPSLAFTSDPDTGIHRVGANQMSFDTNGLARVQISATSTVVNPANLATGDFQVHGDTVNNIIFTDASADALGFFNATPVAQSTGWSVTNETTDKSFDANATSIDELADVLGTLIETLKSYGILGA